MSVPRDRTLGAVVGLTVVAVAIRLVGLGGRVAHWDEGRVAYWALEYAETGVLFYRPIVHGPLVQLINGSVFGVFGPTDASARLIVALLGGLVPLVALAFRERLGDAGAVALAALLAFDPTLLYYSRFMRSDVPVAVFSFAAVACLVVAIDRRDGRFLPASALALALAFGAKENALAYILAVVGAVGLLVGHRLIAAQLGEGSPVDVLKDLFVRWGRATWARLRWIGAAAVAFFTAVVFVYAPRGRLPSQETYFHSCSDYAPIAEVAAAPTLGEALANPLQLPRLIRFTLLSTGELYACQWVTPRTEDPNPYLEYFGSLAEITAEASTVIVALAAVGFLVTVYRPGLPDDLVSLCFYWGAASLVGYPIITDLSSASWLAVHVVLPLSVPAAHGAAVIYRAGLDSRADRDTVGIALVAAMALLLASSMIWTGYATSVAAPTDDDNPLVQYAQPENELGETLADIRTLSERNDGTDVVVAGGELSNPTNAGDLDRRPNCADWFGILPLPWYFEASDVDVECAATGGDIETALADDPPVVIVDEENADLVDERIDDRYERRVHRMRTTDTPFVYYVDTSLNKRT